MLVRLSLGTHAALLLLTCASVAQANEPLTGSAAYGDWHDDAPGVVRHITPDAMPQPFVTTSARRGASVVQRPAGAALHVPPGFEVEQFAAGLEQPRTMRVAPDGDVFVTESTAGRLRILRPPRALQAASHVFADDLAYPFGIAFWPPGPEPRFVYVAETDRVVRFPYRAGDLQARGKPEVVVSHLPHRRRHATRDLVFSPDGRTMFVLGRFGARNPRRPGRGRTCRRAGVRCRWRQPAHLRHRPAQLHGHGDRSPRPARCGA